MANTAISDFFSTIRFLLGDNDPTLPQYSDAQLTNGVTACIRLQGVPGYGLAPNLTELTPEVSDPNKWALVCLKTALGYIANQPDSYQYKTRAIMERFGSWKNYEDELRRQIYKLENGAMFSGWYNYYTWLAGMSGLPLNLVYTQLNVHAPFTGATIGSEGVSTSGSANP